MADRLATLHGTYADFKLVKTRSVVQVIIEIPIERSDEVHDVLGLPHPSEEKWVALARLRTSAVEEKKKERKPETKAQQAGRLCHDETFQEWLLGDLFDLEQTDGVAAAAGLVRGACGVGSRALLDEDKEAGEKWDEMYTQFMEESGRWASQS